MGVICAGVGRRPEFTERWPSGWSTGATNDPDPPECESPTGGIRREINEAAIGQLVGAIAVLELVRDVAARDANSITVLPGAPDERDRRERLSLVTEFVQALEVRINEFQQRLSRTVVELVTRATEPVAWAGRRRGCAPAPAAPVSPRSRWPTPGGR
ncbi:hypothetical protein OOK41_28195 [Micromonospora sp. NBC_01655]|uniref:hypothetical protein n=1 Tax=Micromonospora sp. NBC_01655 TaxID=2975983 RepID=UPI00224FED71|nr:hypothetical protein [Micromonospora sp. NBC_01655]MCX4474145.1 hypothetical protein [Micromonospora sp. NBC_01655]